MPCHGEYSPHYIATEEEAAVSARILSRRFRAGTEAGKSMWLGTIQ